MRRKLLLIKSLSYYSKTFIAGILFLAIAVGAYPILNKKSNSKSNHKLSVSDTSFFIQKQIELLNNKTPLELSYNEQVLYYINLFINDRPEELAIFLGRAEYYFPIIEGFLDKYSLPLELKYLAVIESGLNPKAKSKSGAVGLWQFLYNTCSLVDLHVDSYMDERCDIYKSTDAACRYLNYLHRTFNNWELAISAYNCGPEPIRKALIRSNENVNFWAIQNFLPKETSNYLPAFIAMNFLFENKEFHNIEKIDFPYLSYDIDSIKTKKALHFEQIGSVLNINVEMLEILNPVYSKNYIPESEKGNKLILPKEYVDLFLKNNEQIYTHKLKDYSYSEYTKAQNSTANKYQIVHVVQKGDFFHKLAMKYNCTAENIKAWNKLDSNAIFPGQKLRIWVKMN